MDSNVSTPTPVAAAPACERIEIHVGEMRQLFNAMDPAPFRERDLDPKAEEFIVDWGKETPRNVPLALVVHLSQQTATAEDTIVLRQAVHEYFAHRATATRARLQRLFRVGRVSLLIGVLFVAAANVFGDLVIGAVGRYDFGRVLKDSFAIGSWVALWRPLEIFLYDWWPIRDEARLFDRLSAMDVQVIDAASRVPA
jgi:hypothetical protein